MVWGESRFVPVLRGGALGTLGLVTGGCLTWDQESGEGLRTLYRELKVEGL